MNSKKKRALDIVNNGIFDPLPNIKKEIIARIAEYL